MHRVHALGYVCLGIVITAVIAVPVGAARSDETQVGRYQISSSDTRAFVIDTATGVVWGKKLEASDGDWGQDFYGNKLTPAHQ
jgi:hypothetical protein